MRGAIYDNLTKHPARPPYLVAVGTADTAMTPRRKPAGSPDPGLGRAAFACPRAVNGRDNGRGLSEPVSYTHLDVYKRQIVLMSLASRSDWDALACVLSQGRLQGKRAFAVVFAGKGIKP